MKIAINGTSGFVGKFLINHFQKSHEILPIKREIYDDKKALCEILSKADVVINLAGANISKRWSKAYKNELLHSRIATTKNLVLAMSGLAKKPEIFISTSAIGIYENGKTHDESSGDFDSGFLGNLALAWEKEANLASEFGIKTAIFRLGVVLGKGGALAQMLPVFRLNLGGILGSGEQDFSWIDILDLARAYDFVIQNRLKGIFNLTSPNPVTNRELTQNLAQILNKKAPFKVPEFVLKLKFGQGAQILLQGQRVLPANLTKMGFSFEYPLIKDSLKNWTS